MNKLHFILQLTALWVGLLIMVGCGRGEEESTAVILAHYEFPGAKDPADFGLERGKWDGIHWFERGWLNPGSKGLWISGREAVLHLFLLGRNGTLAVDCSSHPDLADQGQEISISVNGRELADFALPGKGERVTCALKIPDEVVRQGLNRVVFRTSLPGRMDPKGGIKKDQKRKPLSVLITSLKARAVLNKEERARWDALNGPHQPERDWDLIKLQDEGRLLSPPSGAGKVPDVLIFLLDAARPDHMSCYGYPRKTTPVIDRLAGEGIRFNNAFAAASFTLCSVPSLLTGHSWRDHGVFTIKNALPDELTTLAEALAEAGYFTWAITENANVSTAVNCQQGFHEFIETWKKREKEKWGTNYLVEIFRKRALQGFGPEPVFAFLHMIPPHQPYNPKAEHDRWSDSAYRGDIDGSSETIRKLDQGELSYNKEDVKKLIALYDGNMHLADAWVGRMLQIWRNMKRDRELMVVIISDHGEAFGEHGRFSHNTTIYDEMTRIPFIIYPGSLCKPLLGMEDSLIAITDVMPMLLHLLRIPPPANSSYPSRFLEVLVNPRAERSAVLMRNCLVSVGLRTKNHLVVSNGWRQQELFNMKEDSGARNNRRLQEPERYTSMIGRLRALMESRSMKSVEGEAGMSEEDLENLKGLGYF